MAYRIHDITAYDPQNHPRYFLDANVWIAALKQTASVANDHYERAYVDFFDAIIALNAHTDPKIVKKIKNQPKIVITGLLISEIINAYMRSVAMRLYFASLGEDYRTKNFKQDYRQNSATDYNTQLGKLISDLAAFQGYIELWDDELNNIDPFTILPSLNSDSDFNDFYYYYQFYGKDVPIVTTDGDFIFQDIDIITSHGKLLKLTTP